MNIALFGGTFDPVHRGHLVVARAAARRYRLAQVHFVPADIPPHKRGRKLTAYSHRYAMLALATAGEKKFVPSLLEAADFAGDGGKPSGPSYSVETVRRMKTRLRKSDRLFFIIGMDAFQDIATWRQPEELLRQCEFIVAARPGYSLVRVVACLPEKLRREAERSVARRGGRRDELALGQVRIHLLAGVAARVSATQVREAARKGKPLGRLVSPLVGEYIRKTGLYSDRAGGRTVGHEAAGSR